MAVTGLDFLIIGATKSATTWLQKSLQSDPNVFMPDPELHYFSRHYERGDDWYRTQFAGAQSHQIVGEKSNSYLEDPVAAQRVHAKLPNAKLIVQLRNPVDRAYSDYCMLYRRGEVGSDIESYLDASSGMSNRFLNGGLYYQKMDAYLQRYPRDRLLVLLYEAMLADPDDQVERARDFLGLPRNGTSSTVQKKVKDRTAPMVSSGLRRLVTPLKPLLRPFRNTAAFRAARSAVTRPVVYPEMTPKLRSRLADFYARDVELLGGLVHRDLSGWMRGSDKSSRSE